MYDDDFKSYIRWGIAIAIVLLILYGPDIYRNHIKEKKDKDPTEQELLIGTWDYPSLDFNIKLKLKKDGTIKFICGKNDPLFLHGSWELINSEKHLVQMEFVMTDDDYRRYCDYCYYLMPDMEVPPSEDEANWWQAEDNGLTGTIIFEVVNSEKTMHSVDDGDFVIDLKKIDA